MTNKIVKKLERVVSHEASNLGNQIVIRQLQRMEVNEDEFCVDDLPEFLRLLEGALVLFVGKDKAVEITKKIEKEFDEDGCAS